MKIKSLKESALSLYSVRTRDYRLHQFSLSSLACRSRSRVFAVVVVLGTLGENPSENESWDDFEKRVGMKRNAGKESKRASSEVPNGNFCAEDVFRCFRQIKDLRTLDTRYFVSFEDYEELSVENIIEACEKFYNAPP